MIQLPRNTDDVPVVVLAAGEYPSSPLSEAMLRQACRVVCCDGSASGFIADGGKPYAIVGDCDSLDEVLRRKYAVIVRCVPEQETNDLTKAVTFCLSEGMDEIVILGATGQREDHTVANIALLAEYAGMPGMKRIRMVTDHAVLDAVSPAIAEQLCTENMDADTDLQEFRFESFPGQQVSIFAPLGDPRITTSGLKYPLENALLRGWWSGTLNESEGDSFSIITNGPIVVYRLIS